MFAFMCCSTQFTSALFCFIWEKISLCSLSWPRIHFVGQADPKLNILLPLPPESWAHKDEVPALALQNTSPIFLLTSIRSSCSSFDLLHSGIMPMLSLTSMYTILQCLQCVNLLSLIIKYHIITPLHFIVPRVYHCTQHFAQNRCATHLPVG